VVPRGRHRGGTLAETDMITTIGLIVLALVTFAAMIGFAAVCDRI
jgi:hypothetical protein